MCKKTTKVICSVFVALFAMLAMSPQGNAYAHLGYRVGSSAIELVPYNEFSTQTRTFMDRAVYQWNTAAGRTIVSVSSSTHSHFPSEFPPARDGKNRIYKVASPLGYAGSTTNYHSNGILQESDINLNRNIKWALKAVSGYYDVYSAFLHEAGHVAGLKDLYQASDSNKVMYYSIGDNTEKRTLTQDDKNGVAALYK